MTTTPTFIMGMTFGEFVSLCTIIAAVVGFFWKQRVENTKIKADIIANKQFCEMKILEIEKDIMTLKVDIENHKSENRSEFLEFMKINRDEHNKIESKLDRITEHLIK